MKEKKLYKTLLIDPPWSHFQQGSKGASVHYNLMNLDEIKSIPVGDLAEPDAHLWLWVTNASLRDGFDVIESYGFKTRSIFTWIKPRIGLGHYLRNATEHVLFATRGKAPILFKSQPNWCFAPTQKHSQKPEELYAVIERVSPAPYLELFARREKAGWDVWGDEIESSIKIEGFPVPRYKEGVK